ncbi:mandelate racemase/muconate lactonizing enzyme [Striga asiatica]|uniref:Mandelate racemase/muconate lactonizing enzyme n=1 Tax=Striga asiatica TaxID=4170 RepID=A0A5A7PKQ6_STRAF|nr:mandelate racemase/muconate lactonizing enzyme [Striga asiatica]
MWAFSGCLHFPSMTINLIFLCGGLQISRERMYEHSVAYISASNLPNTSGNRNQTLTEIKIKVQEKDETLRADSQRKAVIRSFFNLLRLCVSGLAFECFRDGARPAAGSDEVVEWNRIGAAGPGDGRHD